MMDRQIQNIVQLRQLLAERFPNLRRFSANPTKLPRTSHRPTGENDLDHFLNTALSKGTMTELVASSPASGSSLVTLALLERARRNGQWLALVDAQDSFDPSPLPNDLLARLLWLRCRNAADAMRAADLLLRDDNVPLALLDLRLSPPQQLRKISSSVWFRMQRLIQHRPCAMLVLTPFALVGSAQLRFSLNNRFSLDDLARTPEELMPELKFELLRSHGAERVEQELIAEAG